ncbi:MAG: hydroxyacid dehydrogenase, partial [Spirochaetales bacterium]|nr:hydroxyacid dehydrogenase [Spirochaetales bacterium]
MKVLVADKFPEKSIQDLKERDYPLVYDASLKDADLIEALRSENPDVLIVRSTKVTGEMIEAGLNLSLIIRAGAGYNTIDLETASNSSVYVANCPGKNAIAVAELAMGLILSIDRRIPHNVHDLWEGKWNKGEYSKADGIYGKTLGIIGVGTIGSEVIKRAKSFGMKIIAWSRSLTPEAAEFMGIRYCDSPRAAAANADVVSVHLALNDETRNFIDGKFFEVMKNGAYFINTSRSQVVDEQALIKATEEKGIRAGLDVIADEPSGKSGEYNGPLNTCRSIYVTHHIGASTDQAQQAVADEALNILNAYRTTGKVTNCVNLMEKTPA